MNKKIILSILASSILVAQSIELEPITITSTAIKTDELKSTDAVEVYTSEDIEKAHVRDIYEFLNQETSVISTPNYGNPFNRKLDMRGFGADGHQNIVITINGRKMNNVDMVPQLLSSISPSSIEKIEIIKSSGIVMGGDGANAGVINIITKQNNDKEMSVYGGTYGTADASFYIGHSDETISISASGEAQKNDGIRHIDNKGNKDENDFTTGAFNLAYTPIEELELRLGASFTNTDVIYAGSLTKDEYNSNPTQAGSFNWGSTHQTYDNTVVNAGVSYYINDKLSINVDGSREKKESEYITYSSMYNYDYKSLQANIDYVDDLFSLKVGFDGFDGDINKRNSTLELSKENRAGYIMTQLYLDKLTLKAGYRYEEIKFKNKANSTDNQDDKLYGLELGASYQLNANSSIFINYSHSYQTASLDRMFSFFSGTFNGYVDPSEADNFNLGYNYITKSNKLKVTAYYIDLENEIYYYADPTYVNSRNTNIDESHKYGLDIYDKLIINQNFNIVLNYNYVQAIIDKEKENGDNYDNNDLPGVSDHNVKATLSYLPTDKLRFALTQLYRSEAYAANDFNNNFSQKQDEFWSTDISVSYTKENLELFAKINNLFNQENGIWIRDDAIYPVNFTTTAIAGFKVKF